MKLLTDKQVADLLSVSREYVWRLREKGLPDPVYIAPKVPRWRDTDIEAWVESKAQTTKPAAPATPQLTDTKEPV